METQNSQLRCLLVSNWLITIVIFIMLVHCSSVKCYTSNSLDSEGKTTSDIRLTNILLSGRGLD